MRKDGNIKIQWLIVLVAVLLFGVKVLAYWLTSSVAILTDALESTINVATGLWGMYSIKLAATPRDRNHPYGHGKVEFLTATIEGTLIVLAAVLIVVEAVGRYGQGRLPQRLDVGMGLVGLTAVVNYWMGHVAQRQGERTKSLQLIASGKHLKTDTYTTVGILAGLLLLYVTKIPVVDVVVAVVFAVLLAYTGYKIVREAVSGIMDEADTALLNEAIGYLGRVRRENWVDLHNLRIIKYGNKLHFDCHLTVPWYFNVLEAHQETAALEQCIIDHFGESIELFVHTDACMEFSCKICSKAVCSRRLEPQQGTIEWNLENISDNEKHGLRL
jgi:cation diffusion facilitator family transporter